MTITDEAVEAAARALDPEIWEFLPSAEQSTRPSAAGLHARRETSLHYARAALTAALPFMGVTQEQGSSQDTGKHPCGEQPSPAVSATAALAPCPFCGEQEGLYPAHRGLGGGKPYAIDCLGCGIDFTPREGMDAVAAWNRRSSARTGEA